MASVWRHPNSRFWTACYTLPNGQRVKKSTKLADRKKALQVAAVLEMEAARGLTEKQARALAAHLFERLGGGNLREEKVREFFDRWLQRKAGEVAPGTLRKYRETANHFLGFIGDGGRKRDLASITARDVAAFRDDLARRLSVGTVNCALKVVRVAFAEAVRAHLIGANEAANVSVLVRSRAEAMRRSFSIAELRQLLAVASQEWRAMILAGLYSGGQRLGDVARWTWHNVDLGEGEIRFRTRKTGRHQVIPITPQLHAILAALPSSDDPGSPVFPAAAAVLAKGKAEHVGSLSNQFHSLLVASGLAAARKHKSTGKGRSARRTTGALGFHSLRHAATSWMKTAGAADAIVQDIVGHDSAESSEHYTHIDAASKRAALARLPDFTLPDARHAA